MSQLGWAALCAAGVLMTAGGASAATVYSESGTLTPFCPGQSGQCLDHFELGGDRGPLPYNHTDARLAGAYTYTLTFSDLSPIYDIEAQLSDYTSASRYVDGIYDSGHDGFGFLSSDPSFHQIPGGFAGSFTVGPASDVTTEVEDSDGIFHQVRDTATPRTGVVFDVFLNTGATHYDLVISQLAPIPEPQSWALMIGGFGLAGAALRRRRNVLG